MWRIAVAIVLFLLSLLILVKAPTNFFWRLSVAITEFPYVSILLSVAFLISCLYAGRYKAFLLIISTITTCIYCLPVIEVYLRGRNLSMELAAQFPYTEKSDYLKQPFSLVKLFGGIGIKDNPPEIYTYKKNPEKDLSFDFYRCPSSTPLPCIIVIHGGSWSSGDSKQLPALNNYLSARGCQVAAMNYRLAPAYKSPAQVEDTRDLLHYLKQHAKELNIDSSKFVFIGRSAGAQIALVAAYTFHDPAIKGVVSLYGPADMVWGARIKSNKLVLNTDKVFRDYFGGLIDEVPEKYQEASAFNFVDYNSPPTLLAHGPNDALVAYGHSERLSKKLSEHKVPNYFLNLPWATHGCDYNINGPSGQIITYSIERFINAVTK